LPGIEVCTIDDLRPVVERTLAQRSTELPAAYAIVRAEVTRFTRWLSRRETARPSARSAPRSSRRERVAAASWPDGDEVRVLLPVSDQG
jgi:glutamyl-tRNA reductase